MPDIVFSDAVLSEDKRYRYTLVRRWGTESDPVLTFIMLNPSTADAQENDPTVRRCMHFAEANRYGGMAVINLFALRSSDPSELCKHPHYTCVGPDNDKRIREHLSMSQHHNIVAAWGAHAVAASRYASVQRLIPPSSNLMCLGVTKDGHPRHPLYLPNVTLLRPFRFPA